MFMSVIAVRYTYHYHHYYYYYYYYYYYSYHYYYARVPHMACESWQCTAYLIRLQAERVKK